VANPKMMMMIMMRVNMSGRRDFIHRFYAHEPAARSGGTPPR
jgi:hypothetical protein